MKNLVLCLLLVSCVFGDLYLHYPPGSNNRLSENGVNTQNQQRLFDSQNNAKGGYCWGPTMTFYEGSYLQIEWTNQHGCGSGHTNVDCDLIIQYMCDPIIRDGNGQTTNTITEATKDEKDANGNYVYGMHESYEYYRKCANRKRNEGLFAADQGNLGANAPAIRTRQDNAGTKYGFECPEERDYYPYWHPSPWKDIVIFTSNTERCAYFQKHTQNKEDKFWCESDLADSQNVEQFNNEKKCGAQYWKKVSAWNIPEPECYSAGWNRDNHLGNGVGGYTNTWRWTLPTMAVIGDKNWINDPKDTTPIPRKLAPCVLRMRYNISTSDYKGGVEFTDTQEGFVDSKLNGREKSPVTQDPYVEYGKPFQSQDLIWHLSLAIDTSQFCRTFQDRSHIFYITHLPIGHIGPIYNLGVRGKRGNIVQTYPAVEYDFTPNSLQINLGDFIHFQWTGCDTNPNGNDGEGRAGTDRSNFVQLKDENGRTNYPMDFYKVTVYGDKGSKYAQDLTFKMAYINQYDGKQCKSQTEAACCRTFEQLRAIHQGDNNARQQDVQNCGVLNAVGANYFDGGLVKMIQTGTFYYMSSRNNNFTNRSQKGTIVVGTALSPVALTATVVGSAGFAGAAVIGGGSWYASTHPGSSVANCFANIKA